MVSAYYCLLVAEDTFLSSFFVWTITLGKCLAIDNLRIRKFWILDWCYSRKNQIKHKIKY